MPKSKRDKKISLTKTVKKGLALKQKIVDDVRNCVEKYKSVYLLTYTNMRNEKMKEVREQWKPSRFFFGKNKVIAIALGTSKEEEVEDDLHKLANSLKGQCCLLFTDSTKDEVTEWFDSYAVEDFARSGFTATQTVHLKEGPLKQFSHAMEPYLRQLGMPTKLERGIVTLLKDFEVCKEGSILTPEQAKILELLEHRQATFKLIVKARWTKGEGYEELLKKDEDSDDDEDMISDDE